MTASMNRYGIGQPVRRVEDQRFLTSRSRYVDDIELPHMLRGPVVSRQHTHARNCDINVQPAIEAPCVEFVRTGQDAKADGLVGYKTGWTPEDVGGAKG